MSRAADPGNYPKEAELYDTLQKDAGALIAGENTSITISSSADPLTKVKDYDLEFKGIDGGGKQYKTTEKRVRYRLNHCWPRWGRFTLLVLR
jgi:hypothetical protein